MPRPQQQPNDPRGQLDYLNRRTGYYRPLPSERNEFEEEPPELEPDYYCLGKTRLNRWVDDVPVWSYCYNVAGTGTEHLGYGRCCEHGGDDDPLSPRLQARYGEVRNAEFRRLFNRYLNDPDPLNNRPELAASRALFVIWQNEWEALTEAMLAWHAAFTRERRGLHDHPLYHIHAFHHAVLRAQANGWDINQLASLSLEQLHELLEEGWDAYVENWLADGVDHNGIQHRVADLRVEKPRKLPDFNEGRRHLESIARLTDQVLDYEERAWINHAGYMRILSGIALALRQAIERFVIKSGYTLTQREREELFTDLARELHAVTQQSVDKRFVGELTHDFLFGDWLRQSTSRQLPGAPPGLHEGNPGDTNADA